MRSALSPYEGLNLPSLMAAQAVARPDHPALIWEPFSGEGRTWTYAELHRESSAVAAGLARRGVAPGQRVLVHLDNCPEFVLAWLGCAYAGAVAVTTNTKSSQDELAFFAEHSQAVGAITQSRHAELLAAAAPHLSWVVTTETDAGESPASASGDTFERLKGDPADLAAPPADPWAPFAIQYTSGTTARPKAVLWSHGNALWGAQSGADHEALRADDVHLITLPLFHTNAQSYSLLATLWVGATAVLQPRFSASRFWDVSQRHRCTWASMIPFCNRALMSQPGPEWHRYRMWGNAISSPASDALFRVKSIGWWGMTETITHGIVAAHNLPNPPKSMGRPTRGYEVKVVDAEGRSVAPGQTGDLLIRGRRGLSLFAEYVDDPQATSSAFEADGFFITGDRVWRDSQGHMFFADRSKDMLKVGGENVAASEIERVISEVAGVREAAVVAASDPMLGETPVAFVIANGRVPARQLQLDIEASCTRALASFKRPRQIRFVEELPRSNLQKVAKAQLREHLRSEAAGQGDGAP